MRKAVTTAFSGGVGTALALHPDTAVFAVPTATFCQVVGWWYWCRVKPQTKKCYLWLCW